MKNENNLFLSVFIFFSRENQYFVLFSFFGLTSSIGLYEQKIWYKIVILSFKFFLKTRWNQNKSKSCF